MVPQTWQILKKYLGVSCHLNSLRDYASRMGARLMLTDFPGELLDCKVKSNFQKCPLKGTGVPPLKQKVEVKGQFETLKNKDFLLCFVLPVNLFCSVKFGFYPALKSFKPESDTFRLVFST